LHSSIKNACAGSAQFVHNFGLQPPRDHAQDMVSNNYFTWYGSSFSQCTGCGLHLCRSGKHCFGQTSEAEVMTEWDELSGHRRNILLSRCA
jgi:uncharacterized protein YkwD